MNQPEKLSPTLKSASAESLVVFGNQIWIGVSAVATQSLLAWLLGPADRGAYAICVLFATVLGVLFSFGADRGTQYFVMAGKIPLSDAIAVMTFVIGLGSTAAIVAGYYLIGSPISFFDKADHSSFLFALPLIPLFAFWTAFRLQLAGLRRFVALAKLNVIRTTFNIVLLAVLLAVFNWGVEGALVAQIICLSLVLALTVSVFRRHANLKLVAVHFEKFMLVAEYGIRYYVARIGHVIDTGMGTMLLAFFATRVELGLFAAASALTLSILMIAQNIEITLLPRIAADARGRPLLVARVARISMFVTAVIAVMVVAVSEPLVRLLLSVAFLDAVLLVRWLAFGVVIQGFGIILMSFFRGNNYPHICSWAVWTGLTVNAIGVIVMYPLVGVSSAAIAMSLGFIGRAAVLIVSFCRINDMRFMDLIRPTRDDANTLFQMLGDIITLVSARTRKQQQ